MAYPQARYGTSNRGGYGPRDTAVPQQYERAGYDNNTQSQYNAPYDQYSYASAPSRSVQPTQMMTGSSGRRPQQEPSLHDGYGNYSNAQYQEPYRGPSINTHMPENGALSSQNSYQSQYEGYENQNQNQEYYNEPDYSVVVTSSNQRARKEQIPGFEQQRPLPQQRYYSQDDALDNSRDQQHPLNYQERQYNTPYSNEPTDIGHYPGSANAMAKATKAVRGSPRLDGPTAGKPKPPGKFSRIIRSLRPICIAIN